MALLFVIVGNMFDVMIKRAKINGQIAGVVSHQVDGGLSILQYTVDIIQHTDHNFGKDKTLKQILSVFDKLSGLKLISIRVFIFSISAKLKMSLLKTIILLRERAVSS